MLALLWRVLVITEVNMLSVWKSIPKVSNFFPIGVFFYLEYCIRLPQSQNDCIEICVHLDPILLHEGLAGRCGIQLGPLCVILPVRFPPPPHSFLPVWYVERAILTEPWGTIPQYTVLLSLSFVTHWFSVQCIIITIKYNIISLLHLTLRKCKLTLF